MARITDEQIAAGITEDSFDAGLFLGKPRKLTIPSGGEVRHYPVRRQLTIDQTRDFLLMEQAVNEALQSDDESKLVPALEQASEAIRSVVREFTPDVGPLSLDENQILGMLAWLAGDVSVAQRLVRVLTAGETPAAAENVVATTDGGTDGEGFASGGEGGVPLPSKELSLSI